MPENWSKKIKPAVTKELARRVRPVIKRLPGDVTLGEVTSAYLRSRKEGTRVEIREWVSLERSVGKRGRSAINKTLLTAGQDLKGWNRREEVTIKELEQAIQSGQIEDGRMIGPNVWGFLLMVFSKAKR